MVVATHDVELAADLATRTVVIAEGDIVTDGPTRDVVTASPQFAPQVAKVLAPVPHAHRRRRPRCPAGGAVTARWLPRTRSRRARRVAIGPDHPLVGLLAFAWPLFVDPGTWLAESPDGPWLFALLVPLLLAVVVAEVSDGGIDAKTVAMLGVLTAVAAALRPLSGGVTGFQPMFVVLIVGGRVFGPGFGFLLGATSMLASALITGGVGPWLPFQMIAAAWVGLGAGLLPRLSRTPRGRAARRVRRRSARSRSGCC